MADAARSYTIVLKDDAELSMSLVAVSQAHDLALPKLNDIKHPAGNPPPSPEIAESLRSAIRAAGRIYGTGGLTIERIS